jgi:hypothetical protein
MHPEFYKLFTVKPAGRKTLAFRKRWKRNKKKSLLREILSKSYSIKIEFQLWSKALNR